METITLKINPKNKTAKALKDIKKHFKSGDKYAKAFKCIRFESKTKTQ